MKSARLRIALLPIRIWTPATRKTCTREERALAFLIVGRTGAPVDSAVGERVIKRWPSRIYRLCNYSCALADCAGFGRFERFDLQRQQHG